MEVEFIRRVGVVISDDTEDGELGTLVTEDRQDSKQESPHLSSSLVHVHTSTASQDGVPDGYFQHHGRYLLSVETADAER